jgi:hypothetical protein
LVDAGAQSTRKAESIFALRAYHVGWGRHASESQADTPPIDVGGMAYTVAELRAGAEPAIDVHCHPAIPAIRTENWVVEHQRRHGMRTSALLPVNSASGLSSPRFPEFAVGKGPAMLLIGRYPHEILLFTTLNPQSEGATK